MTEEEYQTKLAELKSKMQECLDVAGELMQHEENKTEHGNSEQKKELVFYTIQEFLKMASNQL